MSRWTLDQGQGTRDRGQNLFYHLSSYSLRAKNDFIVLAEKDKRSTLFCDIWEVPICMSIYDAFWNTSAFISYQLAWLFPMWWQSWAAAETTGTSKPSTGQLESPLLDPSIQGLSLLANLVSLGLFSPPTCHFSSPGLLSKLLVSSKPEACVVYLILHTGRKKNHFFFSGPPSPHLNNASDIIILTV